jgi:hypothetical protein
MPFAEVADIIEQLGHTLHAVHEAKIIHRDIKPSNIMLCRKERSIHVKLIDFGIARVTDSLVADSNTEVGQTIGTLVYMSPEQLRGPSKNLTPASDVYSLALVASEMLTSHRVFAPTSSAHLHELHEEGVRVLPQFARVELPLAAQNVLLKALEFEPARRYQRAVEFGDALAQSLKGNEALPPHENGAAGRSPYQAAAFAHAAAQPASAITVSKPQSNRAFKLAMVIVAALALSLVVAAALIWQAARSDDNKTATSDAASGASARPAERELSYTLMVTPMKGGQPLQKPFAASPAQTFLSGWQFTILCNSPQDGFLYLLNEGADEKGAKLLRMLFPHPQNNAALSAAVKANQQVQTAASAFDANPGIEKLWLVWASQKVPELERVKRLVNSKDLGAIRDAEQSKAIQDFLKQYGEPKPAKELDKATNRVTVKGGTEALIELLELYHN